MDAYAYALLSLALFAIWLVLFALRPDLRRSMIKESLVGGVAGLLAELWYFRDYWQPPTLMGHAVLSPEDFLAGFALAGIGRALYDVVFRRKDAPEGTPHNGQLALLFLGGFLALLLFANVLGFNSCITSEVIFAAIALIIVARRPDLLPVALWTAAIFAAIGFTLYLVIFGWLTPGYWEKYWLLHGTAWGKTFIGVPLTEIAWFASWGAIAGVAHNFRVGKKKVKGWG